LFISLATVAVAAISAYAVYLLGRETNALGRITKEMGDEDRSREAHFLLVSLASGVTESLNVAVTFDDNEHEFVDEILKAREKSLLLKKLQGVDIELEAGGFSRLHVLDPRIGRALVHARENLKLARSLCDLLAVWDGDDAGSRRVLIAVVARLRLARPDLQLLYDEVSDAMRRD